MDAYLSSRGQSDVILQDIGRIMSEEEVIKKAKKIVKINRDLGEFKKKVHRVQSIDDHNSTVSEIWARKRKQEKIIRQINLQRALEVIVSLSKENEKLRRLNKKLEKSHSGGPVGMMA